MQFDEQVADLTHDHVFLGERHDDNARRTLWVVALTAVMMVGEIIAGTIFNSMALLADGFHMATHAGALAVAAGAYAFAKRHARNPRFTFGTGKVGDLAGFASALALALVAIGIGAESVGRLFDPRPVAFTEATVVAVLGLIVNIVSALLLAGAITTVTVTIMGMAMRTSTSTSITATSHGTKTTICARLSSMFSPMR